MRHPCKKFHNHLNNSEKSPAVIKNHPKKFSFFYFNNFFIFFFYLINFSFLNLCMLCVLCVYHYYYYPSLCYLKIYFLFSHFSFNFNIFFFNFLSKFLSVFIYIYIFMLTMYNTL